VSSTDFHTTDLVDVNWTLTCDHQSVTIIKVLDDTASFSTTAPSWTRTTVGWTQTFGGKSEPKTSRPVNKRNLAPPLGMVPSEFRRDLLRRKTEVSGLSCGGVSRILLLVVLVVHRLVTNGRTDGGRTRDDSKYRTSIASRASKSHLEGLQ